MKILDNKTDEELLQSLVAEMAKCKSELRCAKNDIEKVSNRIAFCFMIINTLVERDSSNHK